MKRIFPILLLLAGCALIVGELYGQAESYARVKAQLIVARQELAVALRSVEAIDTRLEELAQSDNPNPDVVEQLSDYRRTAIELADETARHIDILEQELARHRPPARSSSGSNDPYTAFSAALLEVFSHGIDTADLAAEAHFSAEQPDATTISAEDAFWAEVGRFVDLVEETRDQRAASQRVTRDAERQQEILERMYDIREQADDQRETIYLGMVAQYDAMSRHLGITIPPPPPPPRSTPSPTGSPSGGTSLPPASGQTEKDATQAMADNLRKLAEEEEDPEIREALLRDAEKMEKGK